VTTKTQESSCAWKAQYSDGKLVPAKPGHTADPKPTAGRQGTQITVEDLFYNVPTRRRAFRSASEEYAKILDLVGKYGINCLNVAFTCKKHADSNMGISVAANANTIDRIRQIHGSSVANELIQFKTSSDRWGFKAEGWISNANYSVKRTTFLLFINHRSVESSPLKKAFEQTYTTFLPKGGHPFIYLSLDIEPHRLDVNVHPTKREVRFLNEDEIVEMICDEIRNSLGSTDTSRTFMTQSLLPGGKVPMATLSTSAKASQPAGDRDGGSTRPPRSAPQKPYENNLIRTDARARKITSMIPLGQHFPADDSRATDQPEHMEYEYQSREPTLCRLTTIKELRAEVRDNMHNELTDIFASHTFVGIVDERRRLAAIQGGVKLFLVDYGMVCNEYFYQVGLTDFGNFGFIRFNPPLDIEELLRLGVKYEKEQAGHDVEFDWDECVSHVRETLISRRDMLAEYFSLEFSDDGKLLSIPLLMKGYIPSIAKLPSFLLRLGPFVNWDEEKPCFHTFLKELANFYTPEALPPPPAKEEDESFKEEDPEIVSRRKQLARTVENIMFPAFRTRLVATRGLLKGVLEIANLKGLYRVFERC
jgi:DNA mismatch repair protein MLH1